MKYRWITALCLATAAIPVSAAERPLLDDERLQRPVTFHVKMGRLPDVLRTIGEQCGVKLTASDLVARETVQLDCSNKPASAILRQLAATLGYSWVKRGGTTDDDTLQLRESIEARNQENLLRLRYRQGTAGELNQQLTLIKAYLAKFQNRPEGEVRAEIDSLRAAMEQLPTGSERFRAEQQYFAAQASRSPSAKLMVLALGTLTQEVLDRLFLGQRVLLATRRADAISMPPSVLQALREARQEPADRAKGDQRVIAQQSDDEVIDLIARKEFGTLTLRLRSRRLEDRLPAPRMSLPQVMLTSSRGENGPPLQDNIPGSVTADRQEDLQRPVRFIWHPKSRKAEDPLTYCAAILPCEVMSELAASQPDIAIVGDAYWDPVRYAARIGAPIDGATGGLETADAMLGRLSAGPGREGKLVLGDLLREIARRANVSFHVTTSGWIRCRSTLYFEMRDANVPLETVQRLFGPVVERKSYSSQVARTIAGELTRDQAELLSNPQLSFLPDLLGFRTLVIDWDAWRLLSKLSDRDRQTLHGGAPLAYASLMPRAQSAVREYLQDHALYPGSEPLDLEISSQDLAAARITLTAQGDSRRELSITVPRFSTPLVRSVLKVQTWD